MKVSEMKPKQLKEAREELLRRLNEYSKTFRVSRVSGLTQYSIMLEGGKFPATYDHRTRTLTVWGRGARYSGASVTIPELQVVEGVCKQYFDEYIGGLANEEKK